MGVDFDSKLVFGILGAEVPKNLFDPEGGPGEYFRRSWYEAATPENVVIGFDVKRKVVISGDLAVYEFEGTAVDGTALEAHYGVKPRLLMFTEVS